MKSKPRLIKDGAIMLRISQTWTVVTIGVRIIDHFTPNGISRQSYKLFNRALGVAFVHDLEKRRSNLFNLMCFIKNFKCS